MSTKNPFASIASHRWDELRSPQLTTLDPARAVAVLPLGATEQHGPHLPLQVDTCLVEGVMQAALNQLSASDPVWVLPTQTVGYSVEHQSYPGTLTYSPQTLIAMWCDIGLSVQRAGVKKLLLLNSHGGNVSLMDIVARELRVHGVLVYSASWYNLPLDESTLAVFPAHEHRFGIHGGDIETSMMLALRPDLVDMSQAQNFASTSQERADQYDILGNGKSAKLGWHIQDYNVHGAVGNAAAATAQKGQALIDSAAQQLARLLQELMALPLSTLSSTS
jgi:creatinine amidohydrolase